LLSPTYGIGIVGLDPLNRDSEFRKSAGCDAWSNPRSSDSLTAVWYTVHVDPDSADGHR
jgi:hypothetical protein